MAIQDDNTVLCKGDLKAYHEQILPYLGGNLMLGTNVSDYYSTDEKIVGVWVDGKPIYQKTLPITIPTCVTDGTGISSWTSIGASVDRGISYRLILNGIGFGWDDKYEDSSNPYLTITGLIITNSNSNHPNTFQVINRWTTNNGHECYATIQYTKTTDAANSAVTIPGCYDINRPDLWPANKEIFFGNGLYGYRAVSTIDRTIPANGQYSSDPIATNVTYMLNQGGKVKSKTGGWCFVFGATSLIDNIASGWWIDPSNSNTLKYYIENTKNSTQVFTDFDVWVTYTK